jgi:hypothetical protein
VSGNNKGFDPAIVKLGAEVAVYQNNVRDHKYLGIAVISKINPKSFKVEGVNVEDELFKLDTGKGKDHGNTRWGTWGYAVLAVDHPFIVELRWKRQLKDLESAAAAAVREAHEFEPEKADPDKVERAAKLLLAFAAELRKRPTA